MKKILIFLLIFTFAAAAQTASPKREFRGAWIATVTNIDWPSQPGSSPSTQMAQLVSILDRLKAAGINAVMFQVRTECDALYKSDIEPWSYWLTGQQGRGPSPAYDPLQFAIEEAHKRGIELHAWFNPYRAEKAIGSYPIASNHVTKQHPDWVITMVKDKFKFLDPGLPTVRNYVTKVIMDVVRRYDVDGIHFDDYFYRSGISTEDDATYAAYPRGITNRGDWRRDNVNLLISQVNDSIMSAKPYVKFGISPAGIWKNGVPAGTVGNDNYSVIYCDAVAWLNKKIIDYINPQLYWPFGGGQDYAKLMPWWASQAGSVKRHMYVGQASYRINAWKNANEMPNHIKADRKNAFCQGSVFYNTTELLANPLGFLDSLKNNYYKYLAIVPVMSWKDSVAPNPVRNLRFEGSAGGGAAELKWDLPVTAADGDSANRYVIYRFTTPNPQPGEINDPSKIMSVVFKRNLALPTPPEGVVYYYGVTAMDRNSNESALSNVLSVNAPLTPSQLAPANKAVSQRDTIIFKWKLSSTASSYTLQISTDSTFSGGFLINAAGIQDTFKIVTGMNGQEKYFWRLSASNGGGVSSFSPAFSFSTGFPASPALVFPPKDTPGITDNPVYKWQKMPYARGYRIQISKTVDYTPSGVVLDSAGITADSITGKQLDLNRIYFWRVSAYNDFGVSPWSDSWRFKTTTTSVDDDYKGIPESYSLNQNYPNPFNPSTRISYGLAKAGNVRLTVYSLLGEEIAVLVNGYQNAGNYTVEFNADDVTRDLSSGVYFYSIMSGDFTATKKLVLIK